MFRFVFLFIIIFNNFSSNESKTLHKSYDLLLSKYVSSTGLADYRNFKKDEKLLDSYLELLKQNPPNRSDSKNEKLAYWINAYNAFTIKLILQNYPVRSIQNIENGKAWDKIWINIGGKNYSLNNIEHDIIRKQFNDPRIHFALNCSALSCPPLLNHAYEGSKLEAQLEQQSHSFINNPKYNQLTKAELKLSMIFKWYQDDFGDVRKFIAKYAGINPKAKISWLEYDWRLNEK